MWNENDAIGYREVDREYHAGHDRMKDPWGLSVPLLGCIRSRLHV